MNKQNDIVADEYLLTPEVISSDKSKTCGDEEKGAITLVEMLERNARELPKKTAIVFHDSKTSYSELNDTVNRFANFLLASDFEKGDRVGLVLPRIPELVIGFLAVAKAHGLAVPVNFELSEEDIRAILDTISPKYLIVHATFLDHVRRAMPEGAKISIITVGDGNSDYLLWDDIAGDGKAVNPCLHIKDDDVVYLNYTSGSTGNSKGAITTHSNIYWNTIASVDALGLTPEDVHLCMFAPFAHPHEIFARPLFLGGTMVFVDKVYPKSIAEAIYHHKVTCIMGLSPMYENLLKMLEHKKYDLSSLRIPESGGMYTRIELIEKFKQKVGVPIISVWGSTETTGIVFANRPGKYILPGTAGKACFSYEVKIVDENDNELSPGGVGEMIVKGPAVVQGYYNDELSYQISFNDGWYYSGDLGKMDVEGNFYFVERKAGMIKFAGLKVYPLEIELVLMEHSGIKEVAVISAKDKLRGEVPKAIIVTKNGTGITEKEVKNFCKERLANYKIPRIVEIKDSLPKIGSGKVNKKALQKENA